MIFFQKKIWICPLKLIKSFIRIDAQHKNINISLTNIINNPIKNFLQLIQQLLVCLPKNDLSIELIMIF